MICEEELDEEMGSNGTEGSRERSQKVELSEVKDMRGIQHNI